MEKSSTVKALLAEKHRLMYQLKLNTEMIRKVLNYEKRKAKEEEQRLQTIRLRDLKKKERQKEKEQNKLNRLIAKQNANTAYDNYKELVAENESKLLERKKRQELNWKSKPHIREVLTSTGWLENAINSVQPISDCTNQLTML
jgi:hypothetical protein